MVIPSSFTHHPRCWVLLLGCWVLTGLIGLQSAILCRSIRVDGNCWRSAYRLFADWSSHLLTPLFGAMVFVTTDSVQVSHSDQLVHSD